MGIAALKSMPTDLVGDDLDRAAEPREISLEVLAFCAREGTPHLPAR
jgi:hypothetical protein